MTATELENTAPQNTPLFQVSAETRIAVSPDDVYATVSDLPRSGEWSVECTGGQWISGTPATVGAVFRGENHRPEDVVAWAPVVRGEWSTESEIVEAEPGRVIRWAIRDRAGQRQESVWSFELRAAGDGGCVLVHRFWMGRPTEGIRGITADMDPAQRQTFFRDWTAKLTADLTATVQRIKQVIEKN
ncbi:Polyketide cyclase / dehydrase and lipid transport [Streptomyces sp. yr375]|uniref:SRPBCC family protein n=1 Tax=Streptomyces sp. yr375 TaxID=1761906 RepID=UPI0008BCF716|nr:SRPBCC family protein [Streptomyces sp. yr375]SER61737.1 Polyketide cyclase / dehydrase and lipid transport [Streptomyces sp. yr375]